MLGSIEKIVKGLGVCMKFGNNASSAALLKKKKKVE